MLALYLNSSALPDCQGGAREGGQSARQRKKLKCGAKARRTMRRPTIRPKLCGMEEESVELSVVLQSRGQTYRPRTLPKISTMRILTNSAGSDASERAAVAPVMPTETPHSRLQSPTVRPPQNSAKPEERSEDESQSWLRMRESEERRA